MAALLADAARRRGADVRIVRTGSRGLQWLEPLVEVATADGALPTGRCGPGDVDGLLEAGLLAGGAHALRIGRPEDMPYPGAADAADVRALRPYRSAVARGYRSMAALSGWRGRWRWGRRRWWRRSSFPACAGAAARFPDRHQVDDRAGGRGGPEIRRLQRG
ncbi:MAG: hypothetical protein WDN04_06435 [Rhodospirillales bacterium]